MDDWSRTLVALEHLINATVNEDYMVFCDGRQMPLSEMRRLVKEDMERFRRMDEEARLKREAAQKEREAAARVLRKAQWQAQWKKQFERWQYLNEVAEREVGAEERAQERKQDDENAVARLLVRIAEKEALRRRERGSKSQDYVFDRLTDHQYIELKFAIASAPSRRWLAPL